MIAWNLKRTVDPPDDPITPTEVKEQSRIDTLADDALLDRLIKAATSTIDGPYGIGLCLVEQTWELTLDRFPIAFQLPLYPIQSVESIQYVDENGDEQTLASSVYRVDTHSNPARITLAWNQTWPSARLVSNAVTVTFKAGYAPDGSSPTDYRANIPADLRQALLLLTAYWYDNRETVNVGNIVNEMPFAVNAILDRYRIPGFG